MNLENPLKSSLSPENEPLDRTIPEATCSHRSQYIPSLRAALWAYFILLLASDNDSEVALRLDRCDCRRQQLWCPMLHILVISLLCCRIPVPPLTSLHFVYFKTRKHWRKIYKNGSVEKPGKLQQTTSLFKNWPLKLEMITWLMGEIMAEEEQIPVCR